MWGGGVAVAFTGSSADLVNCTFSDNTAVKGGGYAQYRTEEVSSIRNSILWLDDATSSGDEILIEGTTTANRLVIRNSDIRDRSGAGVDAPTGTIDYGTPDTNIGENTTTHDPNFDGTYHLQCRSPCINKGLNSVVPADAYDLDDDASSTEATPDLYLLERFAGNPTTVDMGAFEKPYTPAACPGEVTGNELVNIDDLLAIIGSWGSCTVCTYDIWPQPCGDDTVDINDLLVVIGNWCCPVSPPCPMSLDDVEDCMDAATLEYQPYSPEWIDFVEKCAEAFED